MNSWTCSWMRSEAGEENRTPVLSLEGSCSAIELRPRGCHMVSPGVAAALARVVRLRGSRVRTADACRSMLEQRAEDRAFFLRPLDRGACRSLRTWPLVKAGSRAEG